jgi:mxaK protein
MAIMIGRGTLRKLAWLALAIGLVGLTLDGARWIRDHAVNTAVASTSLAPIAESSPIEVRIAHARALAEANEHDRALSVYRDVETTGSPGLREIARYHSGNVYLRQALAYFGTDKAPRAVPPLELAKSMYREVLRNNPEAWDARYNLERALRMLPEFEDENGDTATLPPMGERAVTTMRGVSQGMP